MSRLARAWDRLGVRDFVIIALLFCCLFLGLLTESLRASAADVQRERDDLADELARWQNETLCARRAAAASRVATGQAVYEVLDNVLDRETNNPEEPEIRIPRLRRAVDDLFVAISNDRGIANGETPELCEEE